MQPFHLFLSYNLTVKTDAVMQKTESIQEMVTRSCCVKVSEDS